MSVRVCFVEQRFSNQRITGPSKHLRELIAELARRGVECSIICERPIGADSRDSFSELLDTGRVDIHELKGVGMQNQKLLFGLLRLIRDGRFDIVHAQGYRNMCTDASALASMLNRIPLVITPRGSLLGFSLRSRDSIVRVEAKLYDHATSRLALRSAKAVVASSIMEMKEALLLGVSQARIHMIPHGMSFPKIPKSLISMPGNPRLLTVSRITPHRNIDSIVESLRYIAKEYPEVVLYVAGDPISFGYDAQDRSYPSMISELAEEEGIKGHLRMLGGVYGDTLWQLYSSADLFVYASSYDNFGFALLEAAYFGLPLVSTRVGIAAELLKDGKGGVMLSSSDPQSIASGVISLLKSHEQLLVARAHLPELAREFSIERNANAHIELYERLTNSSHL